MAVPSRLPSKQKRTALIPTLSLAVALTLIVPLTVAPSAGEVIVTLGGMRSGVGVAVGVGVFVSVLVGVGVSVSVLVGVGVSVSVGVLVGVGVGVAGLASV